MLKNLRILAFSKLLLISNILAQLSITVDNSIILNEGETRIVPVTISGATGGVTDPRIGVLGSSTAVGDVATPGNSWFELLEKKLDSTNLSYTLFKQTRRGHTSYDKMPTGYTPPPNRPSPDGVANITGLLADNPNIIIVNLPSNDVAAGFADQETIDNFIVLDSLAKLNGAEIFFTTTQPRNFPDLSRRIQLRDKAKLFEQFFGDRIIDIYSYLVDSTNWRIRQEYRGDQVHVNTGGHRIIYEKIWQRLSNYINNGGVTIQASTVLPPFITLVDNKDGTGYLRISPNSEDAGNYSFQLSVVDGSGNNATQVVSVDVSDLNQLGGSQVLVNHSTYDYYVYYPPSYDEFPINQPLLLSLHGNAEKGGSPSTMLGTAGEGSIAKLLAENQMELPFIVVSPHLVGSNWNINTLNNLITHLSQAYQFDPDRLYITGFSGGGQAAWELMVNQPGLFAAGAPIAGRTDLRVDGGVNLQNAQNACVLSQMPLKVYHGSNDVVVPFSHSENMVNAVNNCPDRIMPPAELVELTGLGHEIRSIVYEDLSTGNIYDWLLSFSNEPDVTPPVFINNTPSITTLESASASVNVNLDELSYISYGLYRSGSNPTVSDVINATGNGLLFASNTLAKQTEIQIPDLNPSTEYSLFIIARDINQNSQNTLEEVVFTTPADINPPRFEENPVIVSQTPGSVTFSLRLSEPGTVYYILANKSQVVSSEQVKNGTVGIYSNTKQVQTSEQLFTINGLNASSDYFLYVVAEDNSLNNNLQPSAYLISFSTLNNSLGIKPVQTVQINITNSNNNTISGWDNVNFGSISNGNTSFNNLINDGNVGSGLGLVVQNSINGSTINRVVSNNGRLNGGPLPNNVIDMASFTSGTAKMTFRNFDPDKYYSFYIYGGRSASGSRITRNNINGTIRDVESVNNNSNPAFFEKMQPDNQGRFSYEFSKLNSGFGYLNAIIIEEYGSLNSDTTAAAIPTNLSLNVVQNEIVLNWDNVPTEDLSTYNIYRKTAQNEPFELYTIGIKLNQFVEPVPVGVDLYYAVSSMDINGNESSLSNIQVYEGQIDTIPPSTPSPVAVSFTADAGIEVSWPSIVEPDIFGYIFEYSNSQSLKTDTVQNSLFLINPYVEKEMYSFRVRAIDESGNVSPWSATKEFVTPDLTAPTITNLSLTAVGDTLVTISWNSEDDLDLQEYLLYKSIGNSFTLINSGLDTFYIDNTVIGGGTYSYYVTVSDTSGNNSISAAESIFVRDITPPETPSEFKVSGYTNTPTVSLTWQADLNDATSFTVYRSNDPQQVYSTPIAIIADLSYEDSISSFIETYYYGIVAKDSTGNTSGQSDILAFTFPEDTAAPEAPVFFPAIIDQESITLNWTSISAFDISDYLLYRSEGNKSFSEANQLFVSNKTEFIDTQIVEGEVYNYWVIARDLWGNTSPSGTPLTIQIEDITPPATPELSLDVQSDSAILINWNSVSDSDFSEYVVYKSSGDLFTPIQSGLDTFYLDTSVTGGNAYSYYVTASDTSGNFSTSVTESVFVNDITPPSIPSSFMVSGYTNTPTVSLEWLADLTEVTSFTVFRSKDSLQVYSTPAAITTNLTYTDTIASFLETYYYGIVAEDAAGNTSGQSEIISFTFPEDINAPGAPNVLTPVLVSDQVEVQWEPINTFDFKEYNVLRSINGGEPVLVSQTSEPVYIDTDIFEKNTYQYWIASVDLWNNTSPFTQSDTVYVPDVTIPDSVELFIQIEDSFTLNLTWGVSVSQDASVYEVVNNNQVIYSGIGNNLTVANLEEKVINRFAVTVIDSSSNRSISSSIIEYVAPDTTAPAPPVLLNAATVDVGVVDLSWEGFDNDILSYSLSRELEGSSISELIQTDISRLSFSDNFQPLFDTVYIYKVQAKDSSGNISEFSEPISVRFESPSSISKEVLVNITRSGVSAGLAKWNDVAFTGLSNVNTFSLAYDDGTNSNIQLRVLHRIEGSHIQGVADNRTALNGSVFPDGTARFSGFLSGVGKMWLEGLSPENTYHLTFYSARNGSGSRRTNFVVNGQSQVVESMRNISNVVSFGDISGVSEIAIEVRAMDSWAYLNAFKIEVDIDGTNARRITNEITSEEVAYLSDYSDTKLVEFYPNPASTEIKLINHGEIGIKSIELTGVSVTKTFAMNRSGENHIISVKDIPKGIYILSVEMEDGSVIRESLMVLH